MPSSHNDLRGIAMVPHLLYYQLALLAILWLFVMLPLTWPRRSATTPTAPATPIKPKRARSKEPKAFEGLTHKPHCALCERDPVQPKAPPPTRPDPMPPTHRRPREVDTSMHFCPHSDCNYRGWLELGNLRANGHPGGGPRPWRVRSRRTCPWGAAAGVGAQVRPRKGPAPSPRDAAPHVVLRLRRPPGSRAASRTPEGAP